MSAPSSPSSRLYFDDLKREEPPLSSKVQNLNELRADEHLPSSAAKGPRPAKIQAAAAAQASREEGRLKAPGTPAPCKACPGTPCAIGSESTVSQDKPAARDAPALPEGNGIESVFMAPSESSAMSSAIPSCSQSQPDKAEAKAENEANSEDEYEEDEIRAASQGPGGASRADAAGRSELHKSDRTFGTDRAENTLSANEDLDNLGSRSSAASPGWLNAARALEASALKARGCLKRHKAKLQKSFALPKNPGEELRLPAFIIAFFKGRRVFDDKGHIILQSDEVKARLNELRSAPLTSEHSKHQRHEDAAAYYRHSADIHKNASEKPSSLKDSEPDTALKKEEQSPAAAVSAGNTDSDSHPSTDADPENCVVPQPQHTANSGPHAAADAPGASASWTLGLISPDLTQLTLNGLTFKEEQLFTLEMTARAAALLRNGTFKGLRPHLLPGEHGTAVPGTDSQTFLRQAAFYVAGDSARLYPVLHPAELLGLNADLIFKIHKLSDLSSSDFNSLVMPIILEGAKLLLTLPASEGSHDIGAGGLFAHSLRVLHLGLQALHKDHSEHLSEYLKPMVTAAALIAVTHDLGKLETDFKISSSQGESFTLGGEYRDLASFAALHHLDFLKVRLRPGRGNAHCEAGLEERLLIAHRCPKALKVLRDGLKFQLLCRLPMDLKVIREAKKEAADRRAQEMLATDAASALKILECLNPKSKSSRTGSSDAPSSAPGSPFSKQSPGCESRELSADGFTFQDAHGSDLDRRLLEFAAAEAAKRGDLGEDEEPAIRELLALEVMEAVLMADRAEVFISSLSKSSKADLKSYLTFKVIEYCLSKPNLINTVEGEIFTTGSELIIPCFSAVHELILSSAEEHAGGVFGSHPKVQAQAAPLQLKTIGLTSSPYLSHYSWYAISSPKVQGVLLVCGLLLKITLPQSTRERIAPCAVRLLNRQTPLMRDLLKALKDTNLEESFKEQPQMRQKEMAEVKSGAEKNLALGKVKGQEEVPDAAEKALKQEKEKGQDLPAIIHIPKLAGLDLNLSFLEQTQGRFIVLPGSKREAILRRRTERRECRQDFQNTVSRGITASIKDGKKEDRELAKLQGELERQLETVDCLEHLEAIFDD